jgi:hypothetical protein
MFNKATVQSLHDMMRNVDQRLLSGLSDSLMKLTIAQTKFLESLNGTTFQSVYDLVQSSKFTCAEYDELLNTTLNQLTQTVSVGTFTLSRCITYKHYSTPTYMNEGKWGQEIVNVRSTLFFDGGGGIYIQRCDSFIDGVILERHSDYTHFHTNFLKKHYINKRYNAMQENLAKLKDLEAKSLIYGEYLKTL